MCLIFLRRLDQNLFISLNWFRVYCRCSLYFCKFERRCVLPANLVLINWYRGLSVFFSVQIQLLYFNILCRKLFGVLEIFQMGHREALVCSMHIVSTLLPRLLFLTICIFNVNIYSLFMELFVFNVKTTCKVSSPGQQFLNASSLRTFSPFLKTSSDSASLQIPRTTTVLPQEAVVHKHSHTDRHWIPIELGQYGHCSRPP